MPTARFKIGDFSQLAQVSVRTLRLYDELGLIHPAETDRWTGYRYYTLDQLPRLTRILALKDLGLSLGQIAHLMKNDLSAKQMRRMLEQKQAELEQQLSNTQSQMQRVRARLHQIENETAPPKYEVVLKTLNALAFASIRVTVPHLSEMANYRMARQSEMYATLAQYGIKPLDPELFVYHLDEYREENLDTEMGTAVDDALLKKFPDGVGNVRFRALREVATAASVIHHGSIWNVPDAIIALYSWIGRNGLQSAGAYRELHHGWCECFTPEAELYSNITLEIQLPVEPFHNS